MLRYTVERSSPRTFSSSAVSVERTDSGCPNTVATDLARRTAVPGPLGAEAPSYSTERTLKGPALRWPGAARSWRRSSGGWRRPSAEERERPHTLPGFLARLAAKMALHKVCLWLNRGRGRPRLAGAELFGW